MATAVVTALLANVSVLNAILVTINTRHAEAAQAYAKAPAAQVAAPGARAAPTALVMPSTDAACKSVGS
ncbi:unnamed protein product [Cuscuta campestris]|uniref:Uncharacterized protein n=1 Tax=Cuscuta campestris TaxID=132261 RepID=A0A484LJ45_9ASTE|nr:unnamed protein product [Cuscuta campestris]